MDTIFEPAVSFIGSLPENKTVKLSDFYNLMILLGGGVLDKKGLPSQHLTTLSNYLNLQYKQDISSLTSAWNKFFLRDSLTDKSIERWDLERLGLGKEWEKLRNEILPLIENTGLLAARFPRYGQYDALIFHGARFEDIGQRLKFITQFWQNGGRFSEIFVLTGERQLTIDEQVIPDIKTEITLMQDIWRADKNIPQAIRKLPINWINTANFQYKYGEQRGNTEDTVNCWFNSQSKNNLHGKKFLAVANAPLVFRQHVVFEKRLYMERIESTIETVGLTEPNIGEQCILYYLREIAGLLWELNQLEQCSNQCPVSKI